MRSQEVSPELGEGPREKHSQLEKIRAIIEWKWGSKESLQGHSKESEVEEDGYDKEGSKDGVMIW